MVTQVQSQGGEQAVQQDPPVIETPLEAVEKSFEALTVAMTAYEVAKKEQVTIEASLSAATAKLATVTADSEAKAIEVDGLLDTVAGASQDLTDAVDVLNGSL